jgi:uncharacterized membrane protein YfcA
LGSIVGTTLVRHIEPSRLRRVFGGFTLVMATLIVFKEAPPGLIEMVFGDR